MHKPSPKSIHAETKDYPVTQTDGRTDGFSALYSRLADVPALYRAGADECYNGIELYIASLDMLTI